MAGRIQWDNDEKTILLHIYEGVVTLQDYFHVTNQSKAAIKSLPHTVHTIMDRTGVEKLPEGITRALQYANKNLPPNQGMRLIIGAGPKTRILMDIGRILAPKLISNVYFAHNIDEAREIIARHDTVSSGS